MLIQPNIIKNVKTSSRSQPYLFNRISDGMKSLLEERISKRER